ncbi:MAG: alpha-L-fucosidase [Clostridia bacterium]|nr:alpha-L-fucosidase [Clostridia bacterium]
MMYTAALANIDAVIENGRYKDNWASLSAHKTPGWYAQGKLGIFIHWGIYSVPAFGNEWYSRNMYNKDDGAFEHHVKTYGPQKDFGYKDFIPMFRGEHFDAHAWIETFKNAGATFVVPVLEHHDGFAMYDSAFNRWNARAMGPCRDVAGELKSECEKQGLRFCASTHRAEHYFFMNLGRTFESDVDPNAPWFDFYAPAEDPERFGPKTMFSATDAVDGPEPDKAWMEDWLVRTCEIIDNYRPKILYFDWWIQNRAFKPYLKKLAAYYYNRADEWGEEVTIDYKHNAFALGTATLDIERGALGDIFPYPWQTDTAIGKRSWGYIKDNEFKSAYNVITTLIDVVSKNGMLLLNLGPKPDGTFTAEETDVLAALGAWLKINGEGIYGTVPYKFFKEGETKASAGMFSEGDLNYTPHDFRFTYKDGVLYAFQMKPAQTVEIKSLYSDRCGTCVENVTVLGGHAVEQFTLGKDGLVIRLKDAPTGELPICLKIELG